MPQRVSLPLTIFYDGSCDLCNGAIHRYRKYESLGMLSFQDISDEAFRPEAYRRTRAQFMSKLHAIDADGRCDTGVDAVAAIWRAVPGRPMLRFAAALVAFPGFHWAARGVYAGIARYRKLFRKTGRRCAAEVSRH